VLDEKSDQFLPVCEPTPSEPRRLSKDVEILPPARLDERRSENGPNKISVQFTESPMSMAPFQDHAYHGCYTADEDRPQEGFAGQGMARRGTRASGWTDPPLPGAQLIAGSMAVIF